MIGHLLKQLARRRAFVVVASILLLAAIGNSAATNFLHLHYRKEAVALARPLVELPERLGPWLQVSIDEPLNADLEHVLGTDNYIFRDYIDTRVATKEQVDAFKDRSASERRMLMAELQTRKPEAVVNMALTYYTGLVDTVAHVPDRCFVADGFEPTHYEVEGWSALKDLPGDHGLRFIVFEDQTPGRQSVARNVAYFFNCNGQFVNDPITVRIRLGDLTQKYGYYMKVETHTVKIAPDQATSVMNDLLTFAIPEIKKCLPDWDKITSAK